MCAFCEQEGHLATLSHLLHHRLPIVSLTLVHYRGNVLFMPIAHSRLTAQGQISVPSEIRRKLGVGPGSVLEWDEKNEEIIVRKVGQHTLADVHDALFPDGTPKRQASTSLKDGIRKHIRQKYARR
jgi:AbrB family looped-hinge helix DNA binding protein